MWPRRRISKLFSRSLDTNPSTKVSWLAMFAMPPSQVRDPKIRDPVADWHRAVIAHSGASAGDSHPSSFEADVLMCRV